MMIARLPIAALASSALLLVVSGCSDSNSSSVPPPIVASAMIGPAGGAIVVDQGRQARLVLTVPARPPRLPQMRPPPWQIR